MIIRLLKGDAPGRKQVSYYSSELNCIRNSKVFAQQCQTDHLYEVMGGHFNWSIHHTGMGGPTADQKFYDPERVCQDLVNITWLICVLFRSKIILAPFDSKIQKELFLLWPNIY